MRQGSLSALLVVFALLGASLAVPVAGGVGPATPGPTAQETTTPTEVSPSPSVTFELRLQGDGDARWRVTAAFDLDGGNDTAAFRTVADRFEAGTADTGIAVAPFRRAADAASEESGRSMTITGVERSARVVNGTNGTGYLVLQFQWTNFSRVQGDRIVVDDAFETPSGTWLPALGPDQTLVIRPPPDYGVLSAPKGPMNGTLRWTGPTAFDDGAIDITYERGARTTTTVSPPGNGLGALGIALLTGAAALLIGGGAYVWVRRSGEPRGRVEEASPPGTTPPEETETERVAEENEAAESVGAGEAEADDEADGPEATELLSDEERVERLLEANGGRMKQATIVDETGWSNAKVSQLLSSMEEDDRVEKLRIGRENLISLPGEMSTEGQDSDDE